MAPLHWYWFSMFQIKSTGAAISSSSIYPAAKIEACWAAGVQMSHAAKLEAAWIKSDVVYTVFSSILPETSSWHILLVWWTAVEIPDDVSCHSAEIGTIVIMTDHRLAHLILISLSGRNNEAEGENSTMAAAAAIIKRSLWRERN